MACKYRDFDLLNKPEAFSPGQPTPIEKQVALVIGVGKYGGGFNTLVNAAGDARSLADVLTADYGFSLLPYGKALVDDKVGFVDMRAAVQTSLALAGTGSRWLFYFAGHGTVDDGKGYLIPEDAIPGQIDTYLPVLWLMDECRGAQCKEALIILDSCYSGQALVRADELKGDIQISDQTERVIQVITSGNPDQPVLDVGGSGHSVFTQSLLEALEGWSGIYDDANRIGGSRLTEHLKDDVAGRLVSMGESPSLQRVIGGYFLRPRSGRTEFTFEPIVPRLPAQLLQNARGDSSSWRAQALEDLLKLVGDKSELLPQSVELALSHLGTKDRKNPPFLVTGYLGYEPDAVVRSQAAKVLGKLGSQSVTEELIIALQDEAQVCRAAAHALGSLQARGAVDALLKQLTEAEEDVFLDLVDAIGELGETETMVAALAECLRRGKLVPLIGPDLPEKLTGVPDLKTLARGLATWDGVTESDSLAEVAQLTMRGGSRNAFNSYLGGAVNDQLKKTGIFHTVLSSLKFPFIINATYDKLLQKAQSADFVVTGEDTKYVQSDQPIIVQLLGHPDQRNQMVVIENDYRQLREDGNDRAVLVNYIYKRLSGKVVLLFGFDPISKDFKLLEKLILNGWLQGCNITAIMLANHRSLPITWGKNMIRVIDVDLMETLICLAKKCSTEESLSYNKVNVHR